MTLKASFVFKNPDSTRDLNARLRRVINRGIVWGGTMTPGVGLTVQVTPLVAVGFDGMTVEEDQVKTLVVAGGGVKQYVVVHARYNEGGAPALPVLNWRVLTSAAYLADPEKDYLIVVGTVTPAGPAVIPGELDFTERDEVNPLGRDWYRGVVANPAGLPPAPSPANPATNRVGDFYFVISDQTFHFWTGAAWEPLNTGSYNTETFVMNNVLANLEHVRFVEGSGVIAGIRPNPQGDFASDTEINFIETPTVVNQIGIDGFTAYVNGHRIQTHGQYLTLSPPPFTAWRYDLVFLEVWREDVLIPESFNYGRNPDGLSTLTLQEIADKGEQLEWRAGIPAFPVADNFNLNPVEPYAHTWRVVKWRLGFKTSVPLNTCLYNPSDPAVTSTCINIDSNPFSSQPAGTGTDDRLWWAPSTTAADGYSWAIPLFVIRRVAGETPPNAIQMFRDGVRHVFPVYPVADSAHAARKALDTVYRSEPTPFMLDHYPYDEPSGFLSGMDFQIETKAGVNNVAVYEDQAHVRVRGIEDWLDLAAGPNVPLPAPPAVVNGWVRQLVYLRMNITLYDNGSGTATARQYISKRHRPYIPSSLTGDVRAQGWKRGYVTFEYVVHDFGSLDVLDEHDSMVAAGWTRGDLTMASKNAQYEDGGVWSRAIAIDADDRVHPYETEWAIPICLIHRRNTQAWHYNTNPNGSAGRPDGMTAAGHSYPDDLVDLRHEVGVEEAALSNRIKSDVDLLMKGKLRTRLANKYRGAGVGGIVAGTRILQSDSIGGLAGTFQLTAADGVRGIWSDAREFFPVSISFTNPLVNSSGPLYDYQVTGSTGVLKLRAPGFSLLPSPTAYASIVRHLPAFAYVNGNSSDVNYLDYFGPPCWTTQEIRPLVLDQPSPATAKFIKDLTLYVGFSSMVESNIPFRYPLVPQPPYGGQPFLVSQKNFLNRAIEMSAAIDLVDMDATDKITLSWWVHYDRSFAGTEYSVNYGLAEVPDTVHSVVKDPGGLNEQVNIGAIYTVVRKTLVASSVVTITASDVAAASGLPGTVILCGVDPYSNSVRTSGGSVSFSSVVMNEARTTITITLTAPFTGSLEYMVFFYTTEVTNWVEVGKGGKSIQALFSWTETSVLDVSAPGTSFAVDFGTRTWRMPFIANKVPVTPFFWTRATAASGDWTFVRTTVAKPGYENSNLLSFNIPAPFQKYVMCIVAAHTPLTSAATDAILINYTYTPYQGLSAEGGNVANTVTAVPKAKSLLHGRVEANTDFYATQSGACSIYSGVDSWTGYPPNFTYQQTVGAMGRATFSHYVDTSLVSPSTVGTVALTSSKGSLNAACVYRLPFPINPNMVQSFYGGYHKGVMDFDLDPGRVGASSGYRSYAPSYEPVAWATDEFNPPKPCQFVNSLTPLSTRGSNDSKETSLHISPSHYQPDDQTTVHATFRNQIWLLSSDPTARMQLYFDAGARGFDVVRKVQIRGAISEFLGTSTECQIYAPNGSVADDCAKHLQLFSLAGYDTKFWTSNRDLAALSPSTVASVLLDFFPGTISEYFCNYNYPFFDRTQPFIKLEIRNNSGINVSLRDAYFVIDSGQTTVRAVAGNAQNKAVDLIVLPFTSYSTRTNKPLSVSFNMDENVYTQGVTSLYGFDVKYPDDWSPSSISVLESIISSSTDGLGHGRGLYLGTDEFRLTMPVFVPGSGTPLNRVLATTQLLIDSGSSIPESVPYMSGEELFSSNTRFYYETDHGGPIAYCFFGVGIRPSGSEHKNKLVLQVSGGPTGGVYGDIIGYSPNDLHGTAIDAFWPTGRPVLKSRK